MANWAKLQENLTGLPVVKRARHGIHFDKGNGEIVANFSGKPCHYEEKGVWKPIDTKLLLLPDGFYGSPHSDVKIHKDGRVKAGGYQQKSALVAAKEGVVDGDKIVREFKFGTQYLYMKEDGFRQETVITRPPTTAEAKYLIASESGELPSKYKRSDITAVDADGAVHEFVNLGQFKKWLDSAAYPVTIDPDFTGTSTAGDCSLTSTTRNDGARTFFSTVYPAHLIRFDLSSISSAATCSAATLVFTIDSVTPQSRTRTFKIYKITDANGDWIEGTGTTAKNAKSGEPTRVAKFADGSGGTTTAWAGSQDLGTAGTDYVNTELANTITLDDSDSVGDTYTFTFNASGLAVLQDWFGDATNNGFVCRSGANIVTNLATSEHATEAYRPVLTVTYTTGSTGVPKHFLHYARLRSN
mgnify:CR=1 FL=1